MLKSITPIWSRLRHVHRPQMFMVHAHAPIDGDQPKVGQRLAERVAASVGSWWFLGGQAFFLLLWLIYNSLVFTRHFDSFPYILLNLLLSFQAAFTGPVLLIAANVGAMRDHRQADRIEGLGKQNEQLAEQNDQLVERLLNIEEMLDKHVSDSLKAHTAELQNLGTLVREVHGVVCSPSNGARAASAAPGAEAAAPVAVAVAAPAAAQAVEGSGPRTPVRSRGRHTPNKGTSRREK